MTGRHNTTARKYVSLRQALTLLASALHWKRKKDAKEEEREKQRKLGYPI